MSFYQFLASEEKLEKWESDIFCRIVPEEDMQCASMYTNKKNCAYLEWQYSKSRAEKIREYIQLHLKNAKRIELWNVWEGAKEEASVYKCRISDLKPEDIRELWGKTPFKKPECIIVLQDYWNKSNDNIAQELEKGGKCR